MSRLSSPVEWVAPLTPILSLALLPLGPLFFPRVYLLFLFVYFTGFLYQQVNHVCKFYITSCRIRDNISDWNAAHNNQHDDNLLTQEKGSAPFEYIHTFVVPNYGEPEGLLKDTIGRLASHR
jgi:hypothetical protein